MLEQLILYSVGIHTLDILESSDRLGGRMMTAHLNGSSLKDRQYHEMGPMRFPYEITDPDTIKTYQIQDAKMVFQLADVLNEMNADKDEKLQIEFITWIQKANNTPITTTARRPDGTFRDRLRLLRTLRWSETPMRLPPRRLFKYCKISRA
jgi:monoamine oxidase